MAFAMHAGRSRRMLLWSVLWALTWSGQFSSVLGVNETFANVIITPKDQDRQFGRELTVSLKQDVFAMGMVGKLGGQVRLYERESKTKWNEVLKIQHPDRQRGFGEKVLLMSEQNLVYGGIAKDPGDIGSNTHQAHVYMWSYGKDSEENEYVASNPIRLDPSNGEDKTDFYGEDIDAYQNWIVIAALISEVEILLIPDAGGEPELKQVFKIEDVLRNAAIDIAYDETLLLVEECDMNGDYIACAIGAVHEERPIRDGIVDIGLIGEWIEPFVVIFAREKDTWMVSKVWTYRELFGSGTNWFEFQFTRVGMDKDTGLIIAGFPADMEGVYGDPQQTVQLGGGRVVLIKKTEDGWKTNEVLVDDPKQDLDHFGFSVGCDDLTCVACNRAFNNSIPVAACYTFAVDLDTLDYTVQTKLTANQDDCIVEGRPEECALGFGTAVSIYKGRAVVGTVDKIYVYDDVRIVNKVVEEDIPEPFCFGAASMVTLLSEGATEPRSVALDTVQTGDRLLSIDANGEQVFSEVYLVEHAEDDLKHRVLHVDYTMDGSDKSSTLTVTRQHLLVVPGPGEDIQYLPAKALVVGSEILIARSKGPEQLQRATVVNVSEGRSRIRNVLTMNDHIVVDGVVASCMTELLNVKRISCWHSIGSVIVSSLKLLHKIGLQPVVGTIRRFAGQVWGTS